MYSQEPRGYRRLGSHNLDRATRTTVLPRSLCPPRSTKNVSAEAPQVNMSRRCDGSTRDSPGTTMAQQGVGYGRGERAQPSTASKYLQHHRTYEYKPDSDKCASFHQPDRVWSELYQRETHGLWRCFEGMSGLYELCCSRSRTELSLSSVSFCVFQRPKLSSRQPAASR